MEVTVFVAMIIVTYGQSRHKKEEEIEEGLIEKVYYFLLLTGTSTCSDGSSSMATPQITQRYVCMGQSCEKASLRDNSVRMASLEKFL